MPGDPLRAGKRGTKQSICQSPISAECPRSLGLRRGARLGCREVPWGGEQLRGEGCQGVTLALSLQTGGSTTAGPHGAGARLKLWTTCWAR